MDSFGLRYDTPVHALEVIINNYLKELGKAGIMKLIVEMMLAPDSRHGCKYLLAEIANAPVVLDFIDEINIPLVPFFLKRVTKKYCVSEQDVYSTREQMIYLLSSLECHFDSMGIQEGNLSDSFYWLLHKKKIRSNLFETAMMEDDILIAEGMAHKRSSRRPVIKWLFYWKTQIKREDEDRSKQCFNAISYTMKKELAWLELLELYDWILSEHININSEAKMDIAWVMFQLGEYRNALELYKNVWENDNKKGKLYEEALRKQVRCLERVGQYNQSVELANSHLSRMPDGFSKAKLMRTLGWSYVSAGQTEEAISMSEKALALLKIKYIRNKEYTYNIARAYNNIGDAYERRGELKQAQTYHARCLRIMKRLKSWKWVSGSYLNLAIVLRKRGELEQSLKKINEAVRMKNAIMDFEEMPVLLYNQAFTELLLYLEPNSDFDLQKAIEKLSRAYQQRNQQQSDKEIEAILALAYIALCFTCENNTELTSAFEQRVQSIGIDSHKEDKKPLIAKAMLLYALVCNSVPQESLKKIAMEEKELPDVAALYERVKRHA